MAFPQVFLLAVCCVAIGLEPVKTGFSSTNAADSGARKRRRAPVLTLIHPFSTTEPLLCTSCEE